MIVKAIKTGVFKEGEDLFDFIIKYIDSPKEKSVIVVTSKIVALSECRTTHIRSKKEKEFWIKKESSFAVKTKYVWLTIKDGVFMASAGIDESNANGKLIFLPKDSYQSAHDLRLKLMKYYKLKHLGLIITDSRTEVFKKGVTGKSIGYSGFQGIKDYKGKRDIFGRRFKFESLNIVDSLATSAVLEMGEGKEKKPIAIIEEVDIKFTTKKINKNDTFISIKKDMYAPFFKNFLN